MWRLGLGVENHGSHVPLTDCLTGKYQVGVRPAGCGSTLTAYPTWTRAYGTELKDGFFHLNGSTPAENTLECCQKCQSNPQCDLFETSDGGGSKCYLESIFESGQSRYRGNWKHNHTAMADVWGRGLKIGECNIFGDTQEERDRGCARVR